MTWTSSLRRALPLLALILLAVLGWMLLRDVLTFETLAARRADLAAWRAAHPITAPLLFGLAYAVMVALSLPGATLATLTGGFLFGTGLGTVVNVTGATLGAIILFWAVRAGFGARLAAGMEEAPRAARVKRAISANQWEMLFIIRLVPLVPFVVANILPALVGVRLRTFAVTTGLGIIPGALVYTSIGAGLGQVLDAGERPDLGVIFAPHVLLPLLGLAALAALPMVLRILRGREVDDA